MSDQHTEISPYLFKEMITAAYQLLEAEKEYINSLNVFPVPDGDTGTNMTLTMKAAVDALDKHPCSNISELSELVADHCILGARGNSGMILANFFKGFAKSLKFIDKLDINSLARAIVEGAQTAYQAVRNPVEGTILTVMNAVAKKVKEFSPKESLISFFEKLLETAIQVQKRTPELLPQLKKAGVVDAGGEGFVNILKAFTFVIKGKKIEFSKRKKAPKLASVFYEPLNYKFSLEFFIEGESTRPEEVSSALSNLGNSLVVTKVKDRVRVHIHTNSPEQVKEVSSSFGKFVLVCKDDMSVQQKDFLQQESIGVVTTSPGEGFTEILFENGADAVITYSKSKPSVKELVETCEKLNSNPIILLPNDPDIIPTAIEAANLSSKKIEVLPTKSIPEGISALLSFNRECSLSENLNLMKEIIPQVKSGRISKAIRQMKTRDFTIKKGDFIGIFNNEIYAKGKKLEEVL
ncbi:DAK2 domain-containing protein, partial [Candidatus Aminicenantes bacterium AC-334-E05]|nr:DAK2 domain-containing protein [Candidatus Aminicenantes bacterium AC-334-E05]